MKLSLNGLKVVVVESQQVPRPESRNVPGRQLALEASVNSLNGDNGLKQLRSSKFPFFFFFDETSQVLS
jgi:hypothetical protein